MFDTMKNGTACFTFGAIFVSMAMVLDSRFLKPDRKNRFVAHDWAPWRRSTSARPAFTRRYALLARQAARVTRPQSLLRHRATSRL